jgi:glycosyltransferase involved in cell wall biosynthesis
MTQVWCGIPVYNNAATIIDVARRSREHIAHVLVIDDGSTDADLRGHLNSLDVAVARHSTNLGKGAALLTAFRYAADHGGEYLITLDGDGQHFPEDIGRLLGQLSPDTILLGSRDEVVGAMPFSSRFGREFSDFWICCETGATVVDTQSGFRAYPINDMLSLQLGSRHYNLEVEIITRAIWAGLVVRRVPIRVWYPDPSQRVSSFRPGLDNLRLSLLHTRLILRQLLPIPHQRLPVAPASTKRSAAQWLNHFWTENSSPMGLAVAAALSVLLGILLWPWGPIVVPYLAMRLHLNKFVVLATLAICLPRALPAFCIRVGRHVLRADVSSFLVWFVGSHIVGFLSALALASFVYAAARRFRTEPLGVAGNHK